jgi:enoyl-CoA hydratase/carnithine racemase
MRLEIDGAVAVVSNDRAESHNAFDDAMDLRLIEVLDEIGRQDDVRVVVWRGEGPSFSSGRDVRAVEGMPSELTHHEVVQGAQAVGRRLLAFDRPIIAALHGWVMGVSFQRALLCDIRIAAVGTQCRLPETGFGLLPDSGGVARLHQMCGPGVASDLSLSGRVMEPDEALDHGIVSRVVEADDLDMTAREMAERIASTPTVTVNAARRVIAHLGRPAVTASLEDELIGQTFVSQSDDYKEMRRARREDRAPVYRNT